MSDPEDEPWPMAPLTRITVSRADYDAICRAIENPQLPTERMKQAMQRYSQRYGPAKNRPSRD